MRLAILSDIHGNSVALEEVLSDIGNRNVDRMICLGDIATLGADPLKVLDILQSIDCEFVSGNHDEYMNNPSLMDDYIKIPILGDSIRWCAGLLSESHRKFLAGFKAQIRIRPDDETEILFYHGSPKSNTDDLLAGTPDADVDRYIAGHESNIMVGGHTHIPMLRFHHGNTIVNAGSVGFPFREYAMGKVPSILACAQYVILEIRKGACSVDFISIALDKRKLARAAEHTDNPLRDALIALYS